MDLNKEKQESNIEKPQVKAETPPPKWGGESGYVKREGAPGSLERELDKSDFFKLTGGIPHERRDELFGKLFDRSVGEIVTESELKKIENELNSGKWGKFRDFSLQDKTDARKLIGALKKFFTK